MKTDAIITYVDGTDPVWIEDYQKTVGGTAMVKRYRDWGTLKYLLRGIQLYLPFVDRVFLVVSNYSQVPQWINPSCVRIVTHSEIIPESSLPTFNSSMIEMFLHRIPDLSEQYIYFNDDIFPVRPCQLDDFFPGGKPAKGFSHCLFAINDFRYLVRQSDILARKALGLRAGIGFIRPQHTCSPMLRSECEKAFLTMEKEILSSLTPIRNREKNYNQYFFLDYMFYSGKALNRKISNKHISLAAISPRQLANYLTAPTHDFVCINDVNMSNNKAEAVKEVLINSFERLFPLKSGFEK